MTGRWGGGGRVELDPGVHINMQFRFINQNNDILFLYLQITKIIL